MATFNKFNSWVEYLTEGANVGSDTFVVFLTNTAPSASNSLLADITQISYTNLSSRTLTTASAAQSGGIQKVVFNDLVLTSTGGTTGPFRYIGYCDTTLAGSPLVGWYDYGTSITLADGENITIDFDATNGAFTVQ